MSQQFNNMPNYPTPLMEGRNTVKDWYFFFVGLWKGLPPENESAVVLGASPYAYQAQRAGTVIVSGGTVSAIDFSRSGTTYYSTGATAGVFPVSALDYLRITYTVAPTVTFVPR